MMLDELVVYDDWDVSRPAAPHHSRLFNLAPVGLGTPTTESLTSYVGRLAEAHSVSVRQLFVHEILPLLDRPHLAQSRGTGLLSAYWRNETPALNGTGRVAQSLVQALETLTGQTDLRFLTLLTWAQVLCVQLLLRRTRAWCPVCYDEWQQTGQVVYEPLVWNLTAVTVCPRHRRRLETACPYPDCQHSFPPLAPYARSGYCSRCRRWLGASSAPLPPDADQPRETEFEVQAWIVAVMGELIGAAPGLTNVPQREQVLAALRFSVKQTGSRSRRQWALRLGLPEMAVYEWLKGETIPSLRGLLQVCRGLETTPLRFVTGDGHGTFGALDPRLVDLGFPPRRARREHKGTDETLRLGLEAELARQDPPPLSLREVAQRLDELPGYLRRQWPTLCQAISERYAVYQRSEALQKRQAMCEAVRQATLEIHNQGLYPSAYRVAQLLSDPHFVRTNAGRAAWHETLRELGWEA